MVVSGAVATKPANGGVEVMVVHRLHAAVTPIAPKPHALPGEAASLRGSVRRRAPMLSTPRVVGVEDAESVDDVPIRGQAVSGGLDDGVHQVAALNDWPWFIAGAQVVAALAAEAEREGAAPRTRVDAFLPFFEVALSDEVAYASAHLVFVPWEGGVLAEFADGAGPALEGVEDGVAATPSVVGVVRLQTRLHGHGDSSSILFMPLARSRLRARARTREPLRDGPDIPGSAALRYAHNRIGVMGHVRRVSSRM